MRFLCILLFYVYVCVCLVCLVCFCGWVIIGDRVLATAIQRANQEGRSLEELTGNKRMYLAAKHGVGSENNGLVEVKKGDFRVQTKAIRSPIRVGGGGKSWMKPGVYQAYRTRRDRLTRGQLRTMMNQFMEPSYPSLS